MLRWSTVTNELLHFHNLKAFPSLENANCTLSYSTSHFFLPPALPPCLAHRPENPDASPSLTLLSEQSHSPLSYYSHSAFPEHSQVTRVSGTARGRLFVSFLLLLGEGERQRSGEGRRERKGDLGLGNTKRQEDKTGYGCLWRNE